MNKLEKRFENIIKENYNKKDFQNKLTFNFEKFEYILIKIVKKQNSNDIWIQRVIILIEALSEGLFKQKKEDLKLEILLKKANLDSMTNLYLDLKEKNINSEKLFDYLLALPGFILDENKNISKKITETAYENHGYIIMYLTESVNKLIEEIEEIEEKRKRIRYF